MTSSAQQGLPTAEALPPDLRPARLDDYPRIAALERTHGLLTIPDDDWARLWRDNPVNRRYPGRFEMGWILEDAEGRLAGSLCNLPTAYTLGGQERIAATGRAWVVDPAYRGSAIWLMDEYFQQEGVDLFINNTVNGLAVEAFNAFGSQRVPVGDWTQARYCITNFQGFAGAGCRIKGLPDLWPITWPLGLALKIRDAISGRPRYQPSGRYEVTLHHEFDDRFNSFWAELVAENPTRLLAVRDRETLQWHFSRAIRAGELQVLIASRNRLPRAYAVLKRHDHPASGLTRMRLADYQSLNESSDPLPDLLQAAEALCVAQRVHVLEQVGCALPKTEAFEAIATSQRALPAWPFYYKANSEDLAARLNDPAAWSPSSYDGDASI